MPLSEKDIRFNQKSNILYATVLGVPSEENIKLTALGKTKGSGKVKRIEVLGSKEKISWKQSADSLVIRKPNTIPNKIAVV